MARTRGRGRSQGSGRGRKKVGRSRGADDSRKDQSSALGKIDEAQESGGVADTNDKEQNRDHGDDEGEKSDAQDEPATAKKDDPNTADDQDEKSNEATPSERQLSPSSNSSGRQRNGAIEEDDDLDEPVGQLHLKIAYEQFDEALDMLWTNGASSGDVRIFIYDRRTLDEQHRAALNQQCQAIAHLRIRPIQVLGDVIADATNVSDDSQLPDWLRNRCQGPGIHTPVTDNLECKQEALDGEVRCPRVRGLCQWFNYSGLQYPGMKAHGSVENTPCLCTACRLAIWSNGTPVIDSETKSVIRNLTEKERATRSSNASTPQFLREWRASQWERWNRVQSSAERRMWSRSSATHHLFNEYDQLFKSSMERHALSPLLTRHPDFREAYKNWGQSKQLQWYIGKSVRSALARILVPGEKYDSLDRFTKRRLWWLYGQYSHAQHNYRQLKDASQRRNQPIEFWRPRGLRRHPPQIAPNMDSVVRAGQQLETSALEDPTNPLTIDEESDMPTVLVRDEDEQLKAFEAWVIMRKDNHLPSDARTTQARAYERVHALANDFRHLRRCEKQLQNIQENRRRLPDGKLYMDKPLSKQRQFDRWLTIFMMRKHVVKPREQEGQESELQREE